MRVAVGGADDLKDAVIDKFSGLMALHTKDQRLLPHVVESMHYTTWLRLYFRREMKL